MHRSHHCAQLTKSNLGATVSLAGWVDTIRDQGGIIFVDLRDREGVTQIQLEPKDNAKLGEQLKHLKPESVIGVEGKVVQRPAGTENKNLPTGEIEIVATSLEIFNLNNSDAIVSYVTTNKLSASFMRPNSIMQGRMIGFNVQARW